MFFTIDGADGAGKSTQATRLGARLEKAGFQVARCRDPGSTGAGDAIRDVLLHRQEMRLSAMTELFLFMAARSQMIEEIIHPAIEQGKIVVCDRFLLSSIAYQGYAGGVPVSVVETIGKLATRNIQPALSFILDVPPGTTAARMKNRMSMDRMEQKNDEFQAAVRQGFLTHARTDPAKIILIDGSQSLDEVEFAIWQHVEPILPH